MKCEYLIHNYSSIKNMEEKNKKSCRIICRLRFEQSKHQNPFYSSNVPATSSHCNNCSKTFSRWHCRHPFLLPGNGESVLCGYVSKYISYMGFQRSCTKREIWLQKMCYLMRRRGFNAKILS